MTPVSVINLLASTSVQVDVFTDSVIQSVKQGEENPLKVLIQLKAFERATERIIKEIKENCLTEADKYPGTEFELYGNKIQKGDVKTEYDYSGCNDPELIRLEAAADDAKKKVDARKAFLKALTAPLHTLDKDTGEVITINPAVKKSTPGLKITIR